MVSFGAFRAVHSILLISLLSAVSCQKPPAQLRVVKKNQPAAQPTSSTSEELLKQIEDLKALLAASTLNPETRAAALRAIELTDLSAHDGNAGRLNVFRDLLRALESEQSDEVLSLLARAVELLGASYPTGDPLVEGFYKSTFEDLLRVFKDQEGGVDRMLSAFAAHTSLLATVSAARNVAIEALGVTEKAVTSALERAQSALSSGTAESGDKIPPSWGTAVLDVSTDGPGTVRIRFREALDDKTANVELEYELLAGRGPERFRDGVSAESVSEAERVSAFQPRNSAQGTIDVVVAGLEDESTYSFVALVRDKAGNISQLGPRVLALPGLPEGNARLALAGVPDAVTNSAALSVSFSGIGLGWYRFSIVGQNEKCLFDQNWRAISEPLTLTLAEGAHKLCAQGKHSQVQEVTAVETRNFTYVNSGKPVFQGLDQILALEDDKALVVWKEASDDDTQQSSLRYEIRTCAAPAECVRLGTERAVVTGKTSAVVSGLPASGRLYFSVRAIDTYGLFTDSTQVMGVERLEGGFNLPDEMYTNFCLSGERILCMGTNAYREVSAEERLFFSDLVPFSALAAGSVQKVYAGRDMSCALMADKSVRCWGKSNGGRLGNGLDADSTEPVPVAGLNNVVSVSALGEFHVCALTESGSVFCFGQDNRGQLGTSGAAAASLTPVQVDGLTDVVQLRSDQDMACVRKSSGEVLCWGWGSTGRLGNGATANAAAPTPVSGIADSSDFDVGLYHGCAVVTGGAVKCWGRNTEGQLGDGTTTNSTVPVLVTGLSSAVKVSVGHYHSCALLADASVWCWGRNERHQLGPGFETSGDYPLAARTFEGATDLVAGNYMTLVKTQGGDIRYLGTPLYRIDVPVDAPVLSGRSGLESPGHGVCFTEEGPQRFCLGQDFSGSFGRGTPTTHLRVPVALFPGVEGVAGFSSGYNRHSCVLLGGGQVQCAGLNNYGQLGNGTETNSSDPVVVSGLTQAVEVSTGIFHTCARKSDGTVWCWGRNVYGALGNGNLPNDSNVPVQVLGITNAVGLSSGYYTTCAALADRTVKCWGHGVYGQLGNGAESNSGVPVSVAGLNNVERLATGFGRYFKCALTFSGEVDCWGQNLNAQMGNGTTDNASSPVRVTLPEPVVDLALGLEFVCALLQSGRVHCWGDWSVFARRVTTYENFLEPVAIDGLSDIVALAAANNSVCAKNASGRVRCWGLGGLGGLGLGAEKGVVGSTVGLNNLLLE